MPVASMVKECRRAASRASGASSVGLTTVAIAAEPESTRSVRMLRCPECVGDGEAESTRSEDVIGQVRTV